MSLLLEMPCQDNAANTAVDDTSASDNNAVFSVNTAGHTTAGPGGSYPSALDGTAGTITLGKTISRTTGYELTLQCFWYIASTEPTFALTNTGTANCLQIATAGTTLLAVVGMQANLDESISAQVLPAVTVGWHHIAITIN